MAPPFDLSIDDDFLICKACGTQFSVDALSGKKDCRICDDPRQFVPPGGQDFTTLGELKREGYHNIFKPDPVEKGVTNIWTEPKVSRSSGGKDGDLRVQQIGIGQRCVLLQTEHGNILWDLISFLDKETISKINDLGGIKAIVISHPHYYTTYSLWSRIFSCPVYTSIEDKGWLDRMDVVKGVDRQFLDTQTKELVPGVTMIKCGGHFDGSVVLHWKGLLFIADTILTVPSGFNPVPRPSEVVSYSFMWSIPNFIPMPPDAIQGIWKAVKPFEFHATFGAFEGVVVRGGKDLKLRLLESAKIAVRAMGYPSHELLTDEV